MVGRGIHRVRVVHAIAASIPTQSSLGGAGDVENDAVDAAYIIDDSCRRFVKEIVVEGVVVGGHAVGGVDGAVGEDWAGVDRAGEDWADGACVIALSFQQG